MKKNIYVGNLTFDTTADDLRELFEQHGTVTSAQIINDRETGRSRGFGFVEMASQADASKAVSELNGRDVGGRQINVAEAKDRDSRGGGGGGGGGRRGY